MKRILLVIIILTIPVFTFASIFTGSGTYSDPYSGGTLTGDQTWSLSSSPIYVSGDLTIGTSSVAGHLTIEAGVTVIFVSTGADIIITGLGQLTANGSSGAQIRFTADNNKNGIYGESGETWGHIAFWSMGVAGPSSLQFCLIEFGRKDGSPETPEGVGGGLLVDFNNITISDCIFRYNYASFGGGIFVNLGKNPSISRCSFFQNTANAAGGGIYLYNSSASIISNCIFDNNYAAGNGNPSYSGGAIQLGSSITDAEILNCTFVNNSAANTGGDALHFYNGGTVVNSIFWGSNNQIGFSGSNGIVDYSAIQGYSAQSHFTNCFGLNSSNDLDGPNFKNPTSKDWSIKVVSPCRDAGTTPSPTVPTDYIGNSRIGAYDIGAYEVQYTGWKTNPGNTDWNTASNWNPGSVPGSSTNVVIPTGAAMYPVGSSYTIGSGYGMVLEPGAQLTMTSLTNYGDLKLRSDASNISSLITNSSGVSAIIELYLTGGEAGTKNYKWHYISIPVSTLPVSIFNGTTLDIVGYAEPRVTTDLLQGWVAWDGYVYSGGGQDDTYKFTDLVPGKGYDYWDNATPGTTFSFTGQLNSSALSPITLSYGGYPTLSGWNLLGNPFPSGIDWDVVTASGYPANTGKAVYFTKDNVQYTYAAGTGIPENATSHIPPMQGFFIRTYGTGNTFTVPTTAREHNSTARYKGAKTIIPLVRLKLTEDSISDETIVRFDESAKPDLDYDFDATKSFYSLESPGIWSITGGVKYAINGQPFPESGTTLSVPITVNLTSDALIHSITATQLQGLDDYNVSLFDNVTGFTANLKTTPTLTFTASAGLITDRFVLKFSDVLTGMENPVVSGNIFNIYSGFGFINIQTLGDDWDGKQGSVTVFDFSGRTVSDLKNIGFSKNSVTHITAPSTTGIYIIELRSGVKRYVGKVVIN